MTPSGNADFTKFVPGFEFLQGLMKNTGSSLPNIGQWIAPSLDPAEIERRIDELRTVQFWLDQNSRMLGATIQALEVQRMTLSTLKGMNVSLGDLQESLKVKMPDLTGFAAAVASAAAAGAPAHATAPAPAPASTPAPESASAAAAAAGESAAAAAAAGTEAAAQATAGMVDAMQWWHSLTQQFTQLAANAVQTAHEAAPLVSSMADAARTAAAQAAAQAAKPTPDAAPAAKAAAAKSTRAAGAAAGRAARSAAKRSTGHSDD
jgi:hypothetical protein